MAKDEDRAVQAIVTQVRPRSSLRKSRSETVQHLARRPLQDRSLRRFEKIIEAVEALLQTVNIEDISAYDIARQANMPAASINYLFPTISALRIELMQRYMRITIDNILQTHEDLARSRNPCWQEWLYEMGRRYRDDCNTNRHYSEVMHGPALNRESRRWAIRGNQEVSRSLLAGFRKVFIIPEIPDLEKRMVLAVEVADALFSRAYIAEGHISDEAFKDAMGMQITYLRGVLPDDLPLAPAIEETPGA